MKPMNITGGSFAIHTVWYSLTFKHARWALLRGHSTGT
jgi:hypothetical protein